MKRHIALVSVLLLFLIFVTACGNNMKYELSVIVKGQGSVVPASGSFAVGSVVTFSVEPEEDWVFGYWQGSNCHEVVKKDEKWILFIDGDKEITAVFKQEKCDFNIDIIGEGTVEQQLLNDTNYDYGSVVELKAVAKDGWSFKEWQGDAIGREPIIQVIIDDNIKITAVFETKMHNLNIITCGEGHVEKRMVKANDSGNYPYKTVVELSAIAENGWEFSEWLGDITSNEPVIEVVLDGDKELRAVFKNDDSQESYLSGRVNITHRWPNPYYGNNLNVSKPGKEIARLPVIDYASAKLNPHFKEKFVPGELIVGFKNALLCAEEEMAILSQLGLRIAKHLEPLHAYVVKIPYIFDEKSIYQEIERLKNQLNSIEDCLSYIEPNYYLYMYSNKNNFNIVLPNDEYLGNQWHYLQVRLPQAWSVVKGSPGVRIAILDTGINVGHPDLGKNVDIKSGYNSNGNNFDVTDRQGHGSHCAGTISADTNNSIGVAGVMWESSIIPVKVLDDFGSGTAANIAEGIMYAAGLDSRSLKNPAQIISMSLGGAYPSTVIEDACQRAYDEGIIIVAAAGNDNGPLGYPAAYDTVISVGATDYNYPKMPQRARYSNFGPQLDVMAPGGDISVDSDRDGNKDGILSTTFATGNPLEFVYKLSSGTSMACPHVAGIIGLMLANGLPASEVRDILHRTSFDLGNPGFDNRHGYGLVNAYWAVNDVKEIKILVGSKKGNKINIVAEETIDLGTQIYTLQRIPPGEYYVYGWIDVQNNGIIDSGDYFCESVLLEFKGGHHTLNLILGEVL